MRKKFLLLLSFSLLLIPISQAEAAMNPNLTVSAENSKFDNHFSGSMVIEVVIRDSSIGDTDEGKGEPDVTINGKSLRMVQATDGNWYAYFANVDKAKIADSTVGEAGKGLDFGV
ncbi:MAG: peptidase, partial [Nitrosopumilaceae archaeon]